MGHCQWLIKHKLWCRKWNYVSYRNIKIFVITPLTNCITKIDGSTTDDAEDLDLVMPMYNLLECSSNYFDILIWQVIYGFIKKMEQLILMFILQIMLPLLLSSKKLN